VNGASVKNPSALNDPNRSRYQNYLSDLSQEAARLLALELFREEKVSLGRAAELCETPLAAFMEFAAAHEVSPIRYGIGELEEDRRTLADLGL